MHLYLREILVLLGSYFLLATASDFLSVYLLGLGDPKFSPWGNIQLRFWGNLLMMIILGLEGLFALFCVQPQRPLFIWKLPASAIAALSVVIYGVVELAWTSYLKTTMEHPFWLVLGLGFPFVLVLLIYWVAKRGA